MGGRVMIALSSLKVEMRRIGVRESVEEIEGWRCGGVETIGYDKDVWREDERMSRSWKSTEADMLKGQMAEAEGNGFPHGIPF